MPSLEQIEKLLAQEPDDAFLNFARAMELAKAQRYDESVAQFDRVLRLDRNYCAAHFHKGKTLLSAGRDDEARAALQEGVRIAEAAGETHARDEMRGLLDTF